MRLACSSGVEGLESVAFCNTDNSLVLVYVNESTENKTTALPFAAESGFSVYTTDSTHDLANTAVCAPGSDTGVTVPAQSVVTVVVDRA